MTPRPLALVLVASPGPIALTLVRRLAHWCDVVLVEGTATFQGSAREPLRGEWLRLTGIDRDRLRVVTTDLGNGSSGSRERLQRDAALPLVWREPDDRVVLALDADEFLDREPAMELISAVREPFRIGLVPLYGAIDRVARSIHCCARAEADVLRDPGHLPPRRFVLHGPLVARVGDLRGRSIDALRRTSRLDRQGRTAGHHLTMTEPVGNVAGKLDSLRHHWDSRVKSERHLDTMLRAGVHHAGWWIAGYREPEPWLRRLAEEGGLREAGPPLPESHLRALRAWAEARLDPALPDELVEQLDGHASRRVPGTVDFLNDLDVAQLGRPMVRHGHVPPGAA